MRFFISFGTLVLLLVVGFVGILGDAVCALSNRNHRTNTLSNARHS